MRFRFMSGAVCRLFRVAIFLSAIAFTGTLFVGRSLSAEPITGIIASYDNLEDESDDYKALGAVGGSFSETTEYDIKFNVGNENNLFLQGFTTAAGTFNIGGMADSINIEREGDIFPGALHIVLYEQESVVDDETEEIHEINLKPQYAATMEETLLSQIINKGSDNVFANQGDGNGNNNNIQRIDFIFSGGIVVSDIDRRGFLILERGGNDCFKIAAITELDVNGKPSAFSSPLQVENNQWGDSGWTLDTVVMRGFTEDTEIQRPSADVPPQSLSGVFVSFEALGLDDESDDIYGYSLAAIDAPADWTNIGEFPNDTDTTCGGLDLLAGGMVFAEAGLDLSFNIEKTSAVSEGESGYSVTYTIKAFPPTDHPILNLEVVDILPDAGFTYQSSSHGGVYDAGEGTVTWDLGSTEPGVPGAITSAPITYAFRGAGTQEFWGYDVENGTWTQYEDFGDPVGAGGALVYNMNPGNQRIYALAGGGTKTFKVYNPDPAPLEDSWTTLDPISSTANVNAGGALAFMGGYVYAMPGGGSSEFLRYNVSTELWETRASLPAAVSGGGALASGGGFIYALRGGGTTGFYRYDPGDDSWIALANVPAAVSDGGAIVYNIQDEEKSLYAFRGGATNSFYRYDVASNSWSALANFPVLVRDGAALTVRANQIYGISRSGPGNSGNTQFSRYDPLLDTWTSLSVNPLGGNVRWGGALASAGGVPQRSTEMAVDKYAAHDGDQITVSVFLSQCNNCPETLVGVTPPALTVTGTNGASATYVSGPDPAPQNIAIGETKKYDYVYTISAGSLVTPQSIKFEIEEDFESGDPEYTFAKASAPSVIVIPELQVVGDIDADFTGFLENTATLSGQTDGDMSFAATDNDFLGFEDGKPTIVMVSRFDLVNDGGNAVVVWETSSEQDTIGFNLHRREVAKGKGDDGPYTRLNDELLPGLLQWPVGGEYRFVDATARADAEYEYKLEELDARGASLFYGPWTVKCPALTKEASSSNQDQAFSARSKRDAAPLGISKRGSLSVQSAGSPSSGERMRIAVVDEGPYWVGLSDIASSLGISPQTARSRMRSGQLELTNRGDPVAWQISGDGILFYGESIDSLYTVENIYWLSQGKSGRVISSVRGPAPREVGSPGVFIESLDISEDLVASPGAFFDAEADFWLWRIALAAGSQRRTMSFPFETPGYAGGEAEIRLRLKGLTQLGGVSDHYAEIYLNGSKLGEIAWRGYGSPELQLTVPAGLLNDGSNNLEVKIGAAPGVIYSYSGVDGFKVAYARRMLAAADRLEFTVSGSTAATVGGFSGSDIIVWDISDRRLPVRIDATRVSQTPPGLYSVVFKTASGGGRYIAFRSNSASAPASLEGRKIPGLRNSDNAAEYLVIAPDELMEGAQSLAGYRAEGGLLSKVVSLDDIYDAFSHGITDPGAIRDFARFAVEGWSVAPSYLLLAGRGTYDHRDILGHGDSLIPAMMVSTPYGLVESDGHYAAMSGNGIPRVAVGRIPALVNAELEAYLSKLMIYESGGDWLKNVIIAADLPDKAGEFTIDSERLAAMVSDDFTVKRVYMEGNTLAQSRAQLFAALNEGAGLMSYLGHAGLDRLSDRSLLTSADASSLNHSGRSMVFIGGTCTMNRSGAPGYRSLGELLAMNPNGGAVASWAPTTLAMHYQNLLLAEGAFESIFNGGAERLGDALLSSLSGNLQPGSRLTVSLLGDPATALRPLEEEESLEEFTVSGYVFRDSSGDGVFNEGDAGLSALPVSLSGVDDDGNLADQSTTTDESGYFEFVALSGVYTLSLDVSEALAAYPELVEPTTPQSYTFALFEGDAEYNFGLEESVGPPGRKPPVPPGRDPEFVPGNPSPPGRNR